MKVTNSDLALHIGSTVRNMKGSDIRNGCPVAIPYWVEVDTDLISELAPLTDTGGGRLARGEGYNLTVKEKDPETGESIIGSVWNVSTIGLEQSNKHLSDLISMARSEVDVNTESFGMSTTSGAEDTKGLLNGEDIAQNLEVEKLERELEINKLKSSQERDDNYVDRNAIKKPAGSQWDGEKGANALIDAHDTVLTNEELVGTFDALQNAIDAEEKLTKAGTKIQKMKAVKSKRELESKLNGLGELNSEIFRAWKKWRNTSEQKKDEVFQSLEYSEYYSVVQRANESGNVGTCEDPVGYDISDQERHEDRSDLLCESSLLEDKKDKRFAGSMLHGRKSIQIQLHQAQGAGATYEDMTKAHNRAKEANQAVHGWRR